MAGNPTKQMTRAEMKAVIDKGESVMHRSRVISTYDQLPDEVEMAKQTPGQVAAILAEKLAEAAENEKIITALRSAQREQMAQEQPDAKVAPASGLETAETGPTSESKDALAPA